VTTNKLITKILTLINASEQNIERCDFQGAMSNLIDKNYHSYNETSKLCEKVIKFLSNRMNSFSLWTHLEAIRFASSIPGCKPDDYYVKLLSYA
jgi:hypothetical protein